MLSTSQTIFVEYCYKLIQMVKHFQGKGFALVNQNFPVNLPTNIYIANMSDRTFFNNMNAAFLPKVVCINPTVIVKRA